VRPDLLDGLLAAHGPAALDRHDREVLAAAGYEVPPDP
jgi:hypothetical protein